MSLVTDRKDLDETLLPNGQQKTYLVLSEEERAKGFVAPVRSVYIHEKCGAATVMHKDFAETYARNPKFYSGTYCCACKGHFPVGADGEFVWEDGSKVGTLDVPLPPVIAARCIQCEAKFTEAQLAGVSGCPKCGTSSLPVDPKKDRTVKLNESELRILTIWASNWAERSMSEETKENASSKKTLACILQRLARQLPGVHLTLASEILELQNAYPSATLIGAGGKVIVPPKEEPS